LGRISFVVFFLRYGVRDSQALTHGLTDPYAVYASDAVFQQHKIYSCKYRMHAIYIVKTK